MRIVLHAVLSLVRKPTKAIMLFFIMLVIFSLVFTGIIIQNSISRSKEAVRRGLGGIVELKADYMKAMVDKLPAEDYTSRLSLSDTLGKDLAGDPAVETYYLQETGTGSNKDYKSAIDTGGGDGAFTVAMPAGMAGETLMPILGSNQDIPVSFTYGSLKLAEGRHRNAEDADRDTALISVEFAGKNGLGVGDRLRLKSPADQQMHELEIIGLFSGSDAFAVDTLYTSIKTSRIFNDRSGDGAQVSSIHFAIRDPMEIEGFLQRNVSRLPSEYLQLDASTDEYKTLTRPLDLMATITSLLLWVVFIAGALILIAIVTLFIRDRRFEIGLLLSNGETKGRIVAQFMLELLVVACLAFCLSALASQLTSSGTAGWIAANQLVENQETAMTNMISIGMNGEIGGKVSMQDVASGFDVAIDAKTMLNLAGISLGLLLLSASAPLAIILAYKPRESLQS